MVSVSVQLIKITLILIANFTGEQFGGGTQVRFSIELIFKTNFFLMCCGLGVLGSTFRGIDCLVCTR